MAELVRGDTRSETVPGKTNGDDPILLTPELRPTSYEGKLKVHRKAELPTSFTIYADQKHDVVFEVSEENVVTIRTKNYPSLVDRVVPWAKKNWTFLSNIFIAIVLSILLADARSDLEALEANRARLEDDFEVFKARFEVELTELETKSTTVLDQATEKISATEDVLNTFQTSVSTTFAELETKVTGFQDLVEAVNIEGVQTQVATLVANVSDVVQDLEDRQAQIEAVGDISATLANLQQQIDSEKESRQIAINDETAARVSNINDLNNRITNEQAARTNADVNLDARIDNENTARVEADATLAARVAEEEEARSAAVLAETTARTSAINDLDVRVSEEVATRTSDVTNLNARIDSESVARAEADTNLSALVTREEENRAAAILAEANARTSADEVLNARVDDEEAARVAAISAEVGARVVADNAINERVDVEEAARSAAVSTLDTRISSEEAARTSADLSLNNRIDLEENARAVAIELVDNRIATEETARADAEVRLTSDIAAEASARAAVDQEHSCILNGEAILPDSVCTVWLGDIDASKAVASGLTHVWGQVFNYFPELFNSATLGIGGMGSFLPTGTNPDVELSQVKVLGVASIVGEGANFNLNFQSLQVATRLEFECTGQSTCTIFLPSLVRAGVLRLNTLGSQSRNVPVLSQLEEVDTLLIHTTSDFSSTSQANSLTTEEWTALLGSLGIVNVKIDLCCSLSSNFASGIPAASNCAVRSFATNLGETGFRISNCVPS